MTNRAVTIFALALLAASVAGTAGLPLVAPAALVVTARAASLCLTS